MDSNDLKTKYSVETTRAAGFRALLGLLIAASLLNLGGCAAVPQSDRDAGGGRDRSLDVAQRAVPGHLSSNPELPYLDISRLPLHAALVVPKSVQATISEHVASCAPHVDPWTFKFPVGELESSAAEEMLSQVFMSVNRVNEKAAARGNHDVFVELSSPVVQMEDVCFSGRRHDLKVRLLLRGTITDQVQTLLGEASFEAEQLLPAKYDAHEVEVVRPALEQALLEAVAGLVRRLATKPKLIEYARAFKAPRKAPSYPVPVTPSPAITAPPIY